MTGAQIGTVTGEPVAGRGGPLAGLVVVELGRYVAAPFAGRLLADWGAEVIKVEEPGGDPMRWGPLGDRLAWSPQFASWNRGKRSVTLDLKTSDGRAALGALLDGADVLLHNLRPAALARLGLTPDGLRADRPRLVVCGVSGFGDTGPHAGRRTFDAVVSAISGLYAQFLDPDGESPTGPAFTDLLAGLFAAQAVLAALHARGAGRGGQVIDVSMLAAAASVIDDAVTTWTEAGVELAPDARQQRQHIFAAAAADGPRLVVQISGAQSSWRAFATAVGRSEWLTDPRFGEYRARLANFTDLTALVREALAQRRRDEWLARFGEVDIPAAPLNSVAEAVADPDVAGAVLVDVPVGGGQPMRMTTPVGTFSATPAAVPVGVPAPGEHTVAILDALPVSPHVRDAVLRSWRTRRVAREGADTPAVPLGVHT